MVSKKFEKTKGIIPKILVLSKHTESGMFWTFSLQRNNFDVVLQNDYNKAVEAWEKEVPDMILIVTNKFEIYVLDLVSKLRGETIIPILVLTSDISENQMIETYLTGVDDCIIKPTKPILVIAKMRAWLRRTWTLNADAMEDFRIGGFTLIFSERLLIVNDKKRVRLTNLELRLMHLLMSKSGRTMNYDEIIHRVWGYQSDADYAALKNIVYRLRRKIEPNPTQPEYLVTLPGIGYKFTLEQ